MLDLIPPSLGIAVDVVTLNFRKWEDYITEGSVHFIRETIRVTLREVLPPSYQLGRP
jgi:hypothetical protein